MSTLNFTSPRTILFDETTEMSPKTSPALQQYFEDLFLSDDSGIGLTLDDSCIHKSPKTTKRTKKRCSRKRSLFLESEQFGQSDSDSMESPLKRICTENEANLKTCNDRDTQEDHGKAVMEAVHRLTSDSHLVADGSRDQCLPTIPGKHGDLNSISPDTMTSVLSGVYKEYMDRFTIIDCRYPYEYEGGHIKGAVNLYTREAIHDFLHQNCSKPGRHVLIFHCEFSSERGPKMYRFLRAQDRELNQDHYPRLHFPEIYLIEGGYKAFYNENKNACFPATYKPMLHKEHAQDLRHFRVKSKSWTAGEKRRQQSRIRMCDF